MVKKAVIITVFLLLVVLIVALMVGRLGGGDEQYLVEIPNIPQEEWPRVVDIERERGILVATNQFDGYQVTVPEGWEVPQIVDATRQLRIQYVDPGSASRLPEELRHQADSVELRIEVFQNPDHFPFPDWLNEIDDPRAEGLQDLTFLPIAHPAEEAYRAAGQLAGGEEELDTSEFTSQVRYGFEGNVRIYIVTCTAIGDTFRELVELCEEQVQSFRLLDKEALDGHVPFSGERFDIIQFDIDPRTGDAAYYVTLKMTQAPGTQEFTREANEIAQEVGEWIESKGVNPDTVPIFWTTE